MISSGLFELFSRGLMWSRVLLVAIFMSAEAYGFAMLLVSTEALIGAFISYPQVKDLLLRQRVHMRELTRTALLFALILPLSAVAAALYFSALLPVLVVLVGALFFGLAQVLLYLHRIDDLAHYNRVKIGGAVLSTAVFLIVLPIEPLFLPLVQLSYCAALAVGFRADPRFSRAALTEAQSWVALTRTWAVFGTQSLVSNASVHGSRLIAGAALGLAEVKVLTMSYMLASGVTFYFAAVMIYAEKGLSRSLAHEELQPRLRASAWTLMVLWGGLAFYGLVGATIWMFAPDHLREQLRDSLNPDLMMLFLVLFAFRAMGLVINPVVIALGRRDISLAASVLSALMLFSILAIGWNAISLDLIGWAMLAASVAQVTVLLAALVR